MIYDRIIIGGGASGLFCASAAPAPNGLILEKTSAPGQKLLLSGSGKCNLSHGGSIKDFVSHYGSNGGKIRTALYKYNNDALQRFFREHGVDLLERSDGKIFPRSMNAHQVLDLLLKLSQENGYRLQTRCPVTSLEVARDGSYLVNDKFKAAQVIIASGGCSYPSTGSDGSMLSLLKELELEIVAVKPALVPVTVQQYPYADLAGISFHDVCVTICNRRIAGDLLFTHTSFSGPAVLNLSRYAQTGREMRINYCPAFDMNFQSIDGSLRQTLTVLSDYFKLPKRFLKIILERAHINPSARFCDLNKKDRNTIKKLLTSDTFSISGTSGFGSAMATSGGVSLEEVSQKTFESKKHPGLFIIGEALDIDGDTGGYNLQFAFSSGFCAAQCVL